MRLIKLDAIDSTNSYLRQLYANEATEDYTCVLAKLQTKGRGQMGTVWESESSKNLTCSILKTFSVYTMDKSFYVSMVVALAIIKSLEAFSIPKLQIKWPNDILSEQMKICGVLIENVIKHNQIDASIIGIGLNVNQTTFNHLPKASSLKLLTGTTYNLEELTVTLLGYLKKYFSILQSGAIHALKAEYESYLFRKNKPSTFTNEEGVLFSAYIQGVTNTGELKLLLEDNIVKTFSLKEVTLLY
ncbi:biotin--[acetyl-CoA-carboxylase] ligase [Tamlana fucoidanivorans]|uniref:Biotin--[acetyl-CoA-carboxylase] ligase n=1 Tax=Allotamlana fucoidanivorans TaxID=2583814 RepID=A0A5C4SPJ5_9FLAO|nr:biotin--[acetyl-CoA-carboxylase] ligase [Tamlana fucoidanivorans]TNJ45733.1 biotin--[acetyl-CoA-carboxylase] ligase [Tamlana fucoidanivorans]